MHFVYSVLLWALLVFPPTAALLVWMAWERKKQLQGFFGEPKLVNRFSKPLGLQAYLLKALWVFLAVSCVILALARPVIENGTTEYPVGTVDVMAIVDVSRSMAVPDYKGKLSGPYWGDGTRLDMARYLIVNEVVPALHANRMGVVTFRGAASPQAFLTDDMEALGWILKRAMLIGSASGAGDANSNGDGSSIPRAFGLAFQMLDLDSDKDHRKVIVLFSDGGNDDGDEVLAKVGADCRSRGIELVLVGLGKKKALAIPIKLLSPTDRQRFADQEWYEFDGEVSKTAYDEKTLLILKNAAGGTYVWVQNPEDFHMSSLIGRSEVRYRKAQQELFAYPLMAALLFLVLAILANREREPASTSKGGRP